MIDVNGTIIEVSCVRPWRVPIKAEPMIVYETEGDAWDACEKSGTSQYARCSQNAGEMFVACPIGNGSVVGYRGVREAPMAKDAFRIEFKIDGRERTLVVDEEMTVPYAERRLAQQFVMDSRA